MNELGFTETLRYLITGGAATVAYWIASYWLEEFEFWHRLKPVARQVIVLAGALLLGIGATWLARQPDIMQVIEPYATAALMITAIWLTTTERHRLRKNHHDNDTG